MSSSSPIFHERNENNPHAVLRERRLPDPAFLAGYSALIGSICAARAASPAVSPRNLRRKEDGWTIYPVALMPGDTDVDHLVFALKHEGVQLLTLKKLFEAFDPTELEIAIRTKPTSAYAERFTPRETRAAPC